MKILFRADLSADIGTGHVFRCLTLADRLARMGGQCHFLMADLPGAIHDVVRTRGHKVLLLDRSAVTSAENWETDAEMTCRIATAVAPAAWLVVYHYALDARWERACASLAHRLMVIDDLADRPHHCDLLLDQNAVENQGVRYDALVPADCTKLLGPRYAMLRPAFANLTARASEARDHIRLLLFFGGADAADVTSSALAAIAPLAHRFHIDIVVGAANPYAQAIAERAATLPSAVIHPGNSDMATLMAGADLCIGAGGTTMWERACASRPLIVVAVADNQRRMCERMGTLGAILYLGEGAAAVDNLPPALVTLADNPWLRSHLARAGRELVDGKGASRVAAKMASPVLGLRKADRTDAAMMLEWRNDPDTRRHSIVQDEIALDDHIRWIEASIPNGQRDLLIGHEGKEPVGVLRYDHEGASALVSIYLAPDAKGRGIGPALLRAGSRWLARERPGCREIFAEVLADNPISRAAFLAAGYKAFSEKLLFRIDDESESH